MSRLFPFLGTSRPVDVVFVGFGHMGKYGYKALQALTEKFRKKQRPLHLAGVIEADRNVIASITTSLDVGKTVLIDPENPEQSSVHSIIKHHIKPRSENFLVYDASPTHLHYQNLIAVTTQLPSAVYLGEKPAVSDRHELDSIQQLDGRIYCDFIETENPVTLTLRNLIKTGFLEVQRMTFWRLNSIGLTKFFNADTRKGVTGGALLDKCSHDVAVTVALLLSRPSCKSLSCSVEAASPHVLMPYSRLPEHEHCFATASNDPSNRVVWGQDKKGKNSWIADGAGSARTRWSGSNGVLVDYHFGWFGVNHFDQFRFFDRSSSVRHQLGDLGLDEPSWLAKHSERTGVMHAYQFQDARILVIEGTLQKRRVKLVANFLTRPGISPFIYNATDTQFLELTNVDYADNPLARVFSLAIEGLLAGRTTSNNFLHQEISLTVHDVLFKIRHQ